MQLTYYGRYSTFQLQNAKQKRNYTTNSAKINFGLIVKTLNTKFYKYYRISQSTIIEEQTIH